MSGKICTYFQTNSCRYGSRCRNRHIYEKEQDAYDPRRKPFGVSVLQRNKYVVNNIPKDTELNRHLQEVSKEVSSSESIWPASCYSYLPSYGNVQGFEDYSPEELRLKAYTNPEEYMVDINDLKANVAELRKTFLNKTPPAQEILSDYLRNGPSRAKEFSQPHTSASSSGFYSSNAQNPPSSSGFFSSAPQSNGFCDLNNNPAFLGQPKSSAYNSNIFAQALNGGNSGFPSNSSSQFMSNRGCLPQSFRPKTSVFGVPLQENSVYKQNIFGTALHAKPNDNSITAAQASQSSSKFSSPDITLTSGKCFLYSQETDLTPEELEQFKATTFTFGKTPLKCPPRESC